MLGMYFFLLAIFLSSFECLAIDISDFYLKMNVSTGGMKSKYHFDDEIEESGENVKFKSAHILSAGVGFEFVENFRTELLLNYIAKAKHKIISQYHPCTNSFSAFYPEINNVFQLSTNSIFKPYMSFGLGLVNGKYHLDIPQTKFYKALSVDKKFKSLSTSFGVGVSTQIGESCFLDLGYKYTLFNKPIENKYQLAGIDIQEKFKSLRISSVQLGLRIKL
jgi:opacity protein-like surface antigen